jgi:hypothetical protein
MLEMVVLFALVAAAFVVVGLYFVVAGAVFLVRGDLAGVMGLIGVLVLYGAYLFARVAWRVRRDAVEHPPSPEQRRVRRRTVGSVIAGTVAQAAFTFGLPVPTAVRVVSVVVALIVVPLILARDFEPSKPRRRRAH